MSQKALFFHFRRYHARWQIIGGGDVKNNWENFQWAIKEVYHEKSDIYRIHIDDHRGIMLPNSIPHTHPGMEKK